MVSGLHPQEPQSVDREFGSCAVDPPGGEGARSGVAPVLFPGRSALVVAGPPPVASGGRIVCYVAALVEQFAKAYGPLSVGTVKVFP